MPHSRPLIVSLAFLLLALGSGCQSKGNPDPWEKMNRAVYNFNGDVDRIVLKPGSRVYEKIVPRFMRQGIANAFDNLAYGNVIANDFLQGKIGRGLGGIARVAVNTTVGLGGTMDPATKWGLEAYQNDFGITFGKWGAKPGPYLVLPIFGPSTVRDAPNLYLRRFLHPFHYIDMNWEIQVPIEVIGVVNARSNADDAIRLRDELSIDPYVFTREAYLQLREARINEDKPPKKIDESFYELDDIPPGARPTTRPVAPE